MEGLGELDINKYLEGFTDLIGKALGPSEAEAGVPKLPKAKIPKTGMSVGAKAMAEKAKSAKIIGHHTMPIAAGGEKGLLAGDPLAMRRFDWQLKNLPEVVANPDILIKDIPIKQHKKLHKDKSWEKKIAGIEESRKSISRGMTPPAEHIKVLSTQEKEGLWKALQGNVETLKKQNPTISEQLDRMMYTPEYRREILQSLATTPERQALYANAGEQAARVVDELAAKNPGLKAYLTGSYATRPGTTGFKPNPTDIDLAAIYPDVGSWHGGRGLSLPVEKPGPSKVHVVSFPPVKTMRQDPTDLMKQIGYSRYGGPNEGYDWIRLATALGVPVSAIISQLTQEQK